MFYFYYSCHNFFLLAIYFYTFASLCNNSTNSSMLFGSINLTADFGAGKPYFTNEVCFAAFDASTTFNGLVRAAIIPRIFGIRCSAIPLAQLTTNGKSASTV